MDQEKRGFINSLVFPSILLVLIWLIRGIEVLFSIDLGFLGISPLKLSGLIGIITAPLIHGSISHLAANSLPLFVLTVAIFYFYREIAWQIVLLIWFTTGLWTWFIARDAYHIGASGVIYGMASFLIFSGLIRKDMRLSIVSFIVVFLYGSFVWGVFPDFFPDREISWESHLMGFVSGLIMAFYYRKSGPQRKKYDWEDEEDEEDDAHDTGSPSQDETSDNSNRQEMKVTYHYKSRSDSDPGQS
ncbi:MAG: rhomboid family intramembrane serine protease [Bacteroidetes bacterium]|nr:rhomboid family intramembrane serine protease [Bacteroidota bacterium]